MSHSEAIAELKRILDSADTNPDLKVIIPWRTQVLDRFQPVFSAPNLDRLSEEDFKAFLRFKENHHWTNMARPQRYMLENMDRLKEAIRVLLYEKAHVADRLERATNMVRGMKHGVATAILHVCCPTQYGVWNSTSEGALAILGILPTIKGKSFGMKYVTINDTLQHLAQDMQVDLWTLDALFWPLVKRHRKQSQDGIVVTN